jgi:hypothetical protein
MLKTARVPLMGLQFASEVAKAPLAHRRVFFFKAQNNADRACTDADMADTTFGLRLHVPAYHSCIQYKRMQRHSHSTILLRRRTVEAKHCRVGISFFSCRPGSAPVWGWGLSPHPSVGGQWQYIAQCPLSRSQCAAVDMEEIGRSLGRNPCPAKQGGGGKASLSRTLLCYVSRVGSTIFSPRVREAHAGLCSVSRSCWL